MSTAAAHDRICRFLSRQTQALPSASGGSAAPALPSALALPRRAAPAVERAAERSQVSRELLRWLIVAAAMIGSVLEVLDTAITNVAIPQMQGNLGATLSQIAWVNTGYIISNVIVLPITGWLSARFGQKRYFATSVLIFTVASILCGAAHSLGSLIFWRIVQGLGGGGLLATGQVILLEAFPAAQRGLATAIFGMGVMIGPSLGPVLGGYLTDNFSWPMIFYVNIPFGILAAALTWLYVPERKAREVAATVDWQGLLLLAIGMGSLQTVLERGQEDDWFSSALIVWLSIAAVAGLCAFVWWELRGSKNPIVDLRILKERSLVAGSAISAVVGVGLYATTFLLPVYLQQSQGFTAYQSGMTLLPSALISMLSFMIVGPLSQKADARLLILIGIASFSIGAFGLSLMTTSSGAGDVFWPLIGRGASLGFLFIPLTIAGLTALKPDQVPTGSGLINLARQLGGSIGIAAFSTLLTRRVDFHRQVLDQQITSSNPQVGEWLAHAQSMLINGGLNAIQAREAALGQLAATAQHQAFMLAFNDANLMIAIAFIAALPLLLLFRKGVASADESTSMH